MKSKIKLVRIDDRLLHATVAVTWSKFVNANYALIVTSDTDMDPFVKEVITLCLPKSMSVNFISPIEFVEFIGQSKPEFDSNLMVIFKDLKGIRTVVENGYIFKEVQIPYPASRIMIRNITEYFNDEDLAHIDYLLESGVKVYFQTSPHDSKEFNIFNRRKEEK